jgi:hypothetical protein
MSKQTSFLFAAVVLLLTAVSCKKDNSNTTAGCLHAQARVGQCMGSEPWTLNTINATGANSIFCAVNLPANLQVNATEIEVEYQPLNDSIPYFCGCGIAGSPQMYIQKIRICSAQAVNKP